jgi:uncharacterized membrane protein
MLVVNLFNYLLWASIIEFIGALLIIGYILAALYALLRGRRIISAQQLVADGALAGLNFKLAGTLLKAIVVHSWQQILMFAAIFALRTILKRLFMWEKGRLQRHIPG